jgi:hypothetical protein
VLHNTLSDHQHRTRMRLISHPIDLYWMGWRSNTAELMHHGWEISANQDVRTGGMQLALRIMPPEGRHGEPYQAISLMERFDYRQYMDEGRAINPQIPVFRMAMAHNLMIHQTNPLNPEDWWAVDATPSLARVDAKTFRLEDLVHFRKIPRNTHDVLLKQASLEEVLEYALKKQEPQQERIRKEMLHREELRDYRRDSEIKAQLRLVG